MAVINSNINDEQKTKKEEMVFSPVKKITGLKTKLVCFICIAMSVYHLYVASVGIKEALRFRIVHLFFALIIIFLQYPFLIKEYDDKIKNVRIHFLNQIIEIMLLILVVITCGYLLMQYDVIIWRSPYIFPLTFVERILAIVAILLVFEATRRTVGLPLVILATFFIAYVFFGAYLPGIFKIKAISLDLFLEHLYLLPEGIFGSPVQVSATYVFLFILFGSFLEYTNTSKFFIDLSLSLTGGVEGGPAKVAVVASALFGTLSGSAVANTLTTGSLTIPLMKKVGYKSEFAGAVEAAASTGGQLMPPVMGSAAFLMADFTGIPYFRICLAALIPSILFYFSIFLQVDLRAKKDKLGKAPRETLPNLKKTLIWGSHMLIPIIFLIFMLVKRYTPYYSVFYTILLICAISMLRVETRLNSKKISLALEKGAKNAVSIAAALSCAGIIVGISGLTGLGLKFTTIILRVSDGNLTIALLLVMIVATIPCSIFASSNFWCSCFNKTRCFGINGSHVLSLLCCSFGNYSSCSYGCIRCLFNKRR
ncbi:hypothetical protein ES708_16518 [subsurface metagenome]